MHSYWCGVCRTTYPAGPDGLKATRDEHRRVAHGGGVPDGERFDPDDNTRPITGRQVVIGLVLLVAVSLLAQACGYRLA